MTFTNNGIKDTIFMLDSGSDPNIIGSNVLHKLGIKPIETSTPSSFLAGGQVIEVKSHVYLKIAINLGKKTFYIKNVKFNVTNTDRPKNAKSNSFYYDKIILGDNVLHELENNKRYPEIYPKFMQIDKNRINELVYHRKGVYDPEWDKKYLDKNNIIIKSKKNGREIKRIITVNICT
ncbi:hypothetical protein LY90DRAFT_510702 [Neocallimastix californiae]|uniref:Uncharacterized protein n=1 Tax=Neocallimastix californiae TaxID=1754190 RepID=A0A1Y2BXK3_9FUNG|nr:hypothetical protein LY90DRAFT_510702 [Neocallimastix californiae]|eukprot:ORY39478.1 hypothetical protein LY90DRAFT_510702 [Neocallimastix californiae]